MQSRPHIGPLLCPETETIHQSELSRVGFKIETLLPRCIHEKQQQRTEKPKQAVQVLNLLTEHNNPLINVFTRTTRKPLS